MAENEVIKVVGVYAGHSCKSNYDVELKFKFMESDLYDAIQFIAGIGKRLQLIALIGGAKIKLGVWTVYRMSIDRNAQTTVVLKTMKDAAFIDNIPKLITDDDVEITLAAKVIDEYAS